MADTVVEQIPIEKEYGKETGITPDDIRKLREWVKTQPHLPEQHITELDLVLAYHSCGRSSEVTKQVLDLHYTLKTMMTSFFQDRRIDNNVERALNTMLMSPLPTRTKEGYAIFYSQFLDTDPQNYVIADILKCMVMVWELWQYEEGTWPGFVMATNLEGMGFGHMARYDLFAVQQFAYFLQEASFFKLQSLHILNAPAFFDKIIALVKPLVNNTIFDYVHVHTVGSKDVEQFLPVKALPVEAGGAYKSGKLIKEEVLSKLRAGAEFFASESNKRVQESLRAGTPRTLTDVFGGVEGSFKQLHID